MKALLLKDFYVLSKQLKIFLLFTILLAITSDTASVIIIIFMGSIIPTTTIAYDEKAKWNELLKTFPVKKSSIILSKYTLGYVSILGFTLISVVVNLVVSNFSSNIEFFKTTSDVIDLSKISYDFNSFLVIISASLIYHSINVYINLKFGSEKSRIVFIVLMVLIGSISGFYGEKINVLIRNTDFTAPFLLVSITILINIVSIALSLRIKNLK